MSVHLHTYYLEQPIMQLPWYKNPWATAGGLSLICGDCHGSKKRMLSITWYFSGNKFFDYSKQMNSTYSHWKHSHGDC